MANVNQSQLNKGRLDKFLLVFTLPEVLKKISSNNLDARGNTSVIEDSLQFSVYGAVTPKIVVPAIEQGYAGQFYKISSHTRPVYDNLVVNFTVDSLFNNYWVLYKWLNLLNDEKSSSYDGQNLLNTPNIATANKNFNVSDGPPVQYQADITLYGKDEFDNNIIKFLYKNAFPVSLGNIDFNYRSADEIETTFEFGFSQLNVELL